MYLVIKLYIYVHVHTLGSPQSGVHTRTYTCTHTKLVADVCADVSCLVIRRTALSIIEVAALASLLRCLTTGLIVCLLFLLPPLHGSGEADSRALLLQLIVPVSPYNCNMFIGKERKSMHSCTLADGRKAESERKTITKSTEQSGSRKKNCPVAGDRAG